MGAEDRPNPEEILSAIMREESSRNKGKLKIFLGMAAGVGKTYAMLEAGQKLKKEGVDVVVGVVDTHGRLETAKLLEGLEILPPKLTTYKGSTFEELDLDALIQRKPQVALIDELAHSNITGSRHPKRWQDVVEILDNGIDVYTTLNVQHIESLKDVVERIAGITIRETVPDLVIETSAFIELVDLTPDELLRRLKEGKVYLGEQSVIAARNFFQPDRLTALREIILRYAAEKIDHDLQGMFPITERTDTWKPRERLLVAVSHSPHSQKLIRITRRLAFNLGAPWVAVHVDDGTVLDDEDGEMLAKNIALARDLGAEVVTTSDSNIAKGIKKIARQKSVTQIIIGRPPRRHIYDVFQRNTLVDRLSRECNDIDLHVIRQTVFLKKKHKWRLPKLLDHFSDYVFVGILMSLLALGNWFFLSDINYRVSRFTFLLTLLSLTPFFRKGPVFFGIFLYLFFWLFLFIPNKSTLFLQEDLIMTFFYTVTAVTASFLTDRARLNREILAKREKSIEALYEIVQEIATSPSYQHTITAVKDRLNSVLEGRSEIFSKQIDNTLLIDESIGFAKNEKEKAAILWVFQNGKEAGWSTSTLPLVQNLYIPLKGSREVVGVLSYHPKNNRELSIEEKNFLYTVGQQLAHHFERLLNEEKTRRMEHHLQIEKIYQSILNLIAELFEGPLLTIQDAVKELKKTEVQDASSPSIHPIERIQNASESLSNILENIMAMVNLSAGLTPIKTARHNLKDLVETCSERLKADNPYHWVIRIENDLPDLLFDYDLIELLFFNLAFHAMEFSPPQSTIEIDARQQGEYIVLSIANEGQSIPPEMVEAAFEKFYRLPGSSSSGLGLGLAIGRAIAQIHGGELKVQNRPQGGMIFSLFLPIE